MYRNLKTSFSKVTYFKFPSIKLKSANKLEGMFVYLLIISRFYHYHGFTTNLLSLLSLLLLNKKIKINYSVQNTCSCLLYLSSCQPKFLIYKRKVKSFSPIDGMLYDSTNK